MSRITSNLGFIAGIVAGAAIGLAISVAMAPRSGQETREQLMNATQDAASTITGAPAALSDRLSQAIQSRTDRFQEAIRAGQEAAVLTERELLEDYEDSLYEARHTD